MTAPSSASFQLVSGWFGGRPCVDAVGGWEEVRASMSRLREEGGFAVAARAGEGARRFGRGFGRGGGLVGVEFSQGLFWFGLWVWFMGFWLWGLVCGVGFGLVGVGWGYVGGLVGACRFAVAP